MPFAVRHRDDPMPELAPLPGLSVSMAPSAASMAALQGRAEEEIARRPRRRVVVR